MMTNCFACGMEVGDPTTCNGTCDAGEILAELVELKRMKDSVGPTQEASMTARVHLRSDDLFSEAAWLALHASLLQDAEYVQMATADFAKHASTILGFFVELEQLRKHVRGLRA